MGGIEQMGTAIVEHGPPAGRGRGDAETKETHGGFGEDSSGHADGGLHDDRLNDVGQNVADNDAQVAGSEGARGFDEFTLAGSQDLSANQAGGGGPSAEREREDPGEEGKAA